MVYIIEMVKPNHSSGMINLNNTGINAVRSYIARSQVDDHSHDSYRVYDCQCTSVIKYVGRIPYQLSDKLSIDYEKDTMKEEHLGKMETTSDCGSCMNFSQKSCDSVSSYDETHCECKGEEESLYQPSLPYLSLCHDFMKRRTIQYNHQVSRKKTLTQRKPGKKYNT